MKYQVKRPNRKNFVRGLSIFLVVALLIFAGSAIYLRNQYQNNLKPVSTSLKTQYFTVEQGESAQQIAQNLKAEGLIKNTGAFEWYLRSSDLRDKLQAGTYVLSPSMSSQQIVEKMVKGDVAKNLLTILPGKRLDEIKQAFKKSGYQDQEIEQAFDPKQYSGHPALVSLPVGASLEGYLYPDSFEKTATTPASVIVKASLDEMAEKLTPDLQAGFARQGLSVRQALILASITLQESGNVNDQPGIAQVFLKRLKLDMMLGSDVTAFYASALAGQEPTVFIDSPYNTRIYKGLPPGPIGNVTQSALEAVASPSSGDYLYFVAGDDGTTHYAKTFEEHEQNIEKYCTTLCGR